MTFILAFKAQRKDDSDCIVISSDSRVTSSFGLASQMPKIRPIYVDENKPIAVAGGSGDVSLIRWAFEQVEEVLLDTAKHVYPLDVEEFRSSVRQIEQRFVARFSEVRNLQLDVSFQMILCGLDINGNVLIFEFDDRGFSLDMSSLGFSAIGSGSVTGAALLRLIDYKLDVEAPMLACFVIDSVSEVDTSVGPLAESYMMSIERYGRKRKRILLSPITPDGMSRLRRIVQERRQLIQQVWIAYDKIGEQKVRDAIIKLK